MKRLKVSTTGFPLKTRDLKNLRQSIDFLERTFALGKRNGEVLGGMIQNSDGTVSSGTFVHNGKIVRYQNTGVVGNIFLIRKAVENDLYNTNQQLSTALEELPVSERYYAELTQMETAGILPNPETTIKKTDLKYYKQRRMLANGSVNITNMHSENFGGGWIVDITFSKPISMPYEISYTLRTQGQSSTTLDLRHAVLDANENGMRITVKGHKEEGRQYIIEWQIFEKNGIEITEDYS